MTLALTFLVGVLQLGFGLAKVGKLLSFVSHSVMIGFTAGAAILIAMSQIKHVFKIDLPGTGHVIEFIPAFLSGIAEVHFYSTVVAGVTLGAAIGVKFLAPKLPNYLLALVIGGATAWLLGGQGAGILTVGLLPSVIPQLSFPDVSIEFISAFGQTALALAMIGLLEAVAIAKSLASKKNDPFDSNQEIIGQGLSNIVGSFFSSYVGSGSFTRSGVNFEAGAQTPIAAILASVFLVLILFLVAPLFAYLPIAAIAGAILLVAWRLIDFGKIYSIARKSRAEGSIILITFASTLFVGLEFAVYAGTLVSLSLFLNHTMRPSLPINAPDPSTANHSFTNIKNGVPQCPQVVFGRIDGSVFFGSVDALRAEFRQVEKNHPGQDRFVLKLTGIGGIDYAGAELLIEEARRRQKRGGQLYLTSRYEPLYEKLLRYGVIDQVGEHNTFEYRNVAIREIVPQLDPEICATCKTRIFKECPKLI